MYGWIILYKDLRNVKQILLFIKLVSYLKEKIQLLLLFNFLAMVS